MSVNRVVTGLLSFTGFRAQSAPPETPVKWQLKKMRKFLKKKINNGYQIEGYRMIEVDWIGSPLAGRPHASRCATRFAGGPDGPAGATYRRSGMPMGEGE